MLYKKGDIIEVMENGLQAEILSYSDEQNPQMNNVIDRKYAVVWKHLLGSGMQAHGEYWHSDVHLDWSLKVSKTNDPGLYYISNKVDEETVKEMKKEWDATMGYCVHSWKEYNSGFSRYDYCEKCDIKKGR